MVVSFYFNSMDLYKISLANFSSDKRQEINASEMGKKSNF